MELLTVVTHVASSATRHGFSLPCPIARWRPTAPFCSSFPRADFPSSRIRSARSRWAGRSMRSTGSAFDLGMVGLVQFIPERTAGFRRRTCRRSLRPQARGADLPIRRGADGGVSGLGHLRRMAEPRANFRGHGGLRHRHRIRKSGRGGLLPGVAPEGMMQKATAVSTAAWQVATISGPALGGLAYAAAPARPMP